MAAWMPSLRFLLPSPDSLMTQHRHSQTWPDNPGLRNLIEQYPGETDHAGVPSQVNYHLQLKVDDLESRSRWCNIGIIGIPQRIKGDKLSSFTESFLGEVFATKAFTHPQSVDRAHRLPVQRRQDGASRLSIACIHQVKQRIMQLALERGSPAFRDNEVHIYPDNSAEVSKRRAAFTPLKAELRRDR